MFLFIYQLVNISEVEFSAPFVLLTEVAVYTWGWHHFSNGGDLHILDPSLDALNEIAMDLRQKRQMEMGIAHSIDHRYQYLNFVM